MAELDMNFLGFAEHLTTSGEPIPDHPKWLGQLVEMRVDGSVKQNEGKPQALDVHCQQYGWGVSLLTP